MNFCFVRQREHREIDGILMYWGKRVCVACGKDIVEEKKNG